MREEYGSLLPTAFVNGVTAPVTSPDDCDDDDLETYDDAQLRLDIRSGKPRRSSNLRPLRIASTALVLLGAACVMVSGGAASGLRSRGRPSSPVEVPTVQRAAAPATAAADDEGDDGEVFEEYTFMLSDLIVRPEVARRVAR